MLMPTNAPYKPCYYVTARRHHEGRDLWEMIRPKGSIFPNMFTEEACYSSLALLYHVKEKVVPLGIATGHCQRETYCTLIFRLPCTQMF